MQINDFPGTGYVTHAPGDSRRHPLVILLAVILFAESALLAAATGYLVVELLVDVPDSYASALALVVLAAIATVWLVVVTVNLLRGRAWTRGAALVWQVLQVAVAVGCFQGAFARPDLGWPLLLPALAALGLLFSRPVVRATTLRDQR